MLDTAVISQGLAIYSRKEETELFDTARKVEKKAPFASLGGLNQSIDKLFGDYDLSDPFGASAIGTAVTLAKAQQAQEKANVNKAPSPLEEKKINDRIAILARKYVRGDLKTEEQARLEILSAYVNSYFPRVTLEAIKKVGEVTESLHSVSEKVDSIIKKYQK